MKSICFIHPEAIRLLTGNTWEFTKNTLWKRFPFYEREIETYKFHIRKYYESIPPELFPEIANKFFISYCRRILLINTTNSHKTKPPFLTTLNGNELKKVLEETLEEVLTESEVSEMEGTNIEAVFIIRC